MPSYEIERTSPLTGKVNTMTITMEPADYQSWRNGELIQNALQYLTADQREFLKTGIYADEWNQLFPEHAE